MRLAIIRKDKTIRDHVAKYDAVRTALRYLCRNSEFPLAMRMSAQMELNTYPTITRASAVHNRCIETGRGAWVLNDFKLCRHAFRKAVRASRIPGVFKANW